MANLGGAGVALAVGKAAEKPAAAGSEAEADGWWKPVLDLGCELTVDLPIPNFKIADLLKLHKGSIVNAQWRLGRDVPLCLNATRIGWIEFEVMGGNLAVRLTELA